MHVRVAVSLEDLAACLHIRRVVFIDEQGVPEADELDELDELDGVCRHVLALPHAGSPATDALGTARLQLLDDDRGKVQRVAVLAAHRRRGVGAALMAAVEIEARRAGRAKLVLGSQLNALPFYERLGWEASGDVFSDAGIPHRMMRKSL